MNYLKVHVLAVGRCDSNESTIPLPRHLSFVLRMRCSILAVFLRVSAHRRRPLIPDVKGDSSIGNAQPSTTDPHNNDDACGRVSVHSVGVQLFSKILRAGG